MSEDRSVEAIKQKKYCLRKGDHSELVDKFLGKRIYSPKKIDFIANYKMTQEDTSSEKSNKHIFYELQSRQNSPYGIERYGIER